MKPYQWSHLNTQQVGKYAEYFYKMELTMYGFRVFTTEVDDRGIDFVASYEEGPFIEIQVKSLRGMGYVFMEKTKFAPRENLYLAFAFFQEGKAPTLYLIPSMVWQQNSSVFVGRDYEGKKSKPEWGLNFSLRNLETLEPYRLDATLAHLRSEYPRARPSRDSEPTNAAHSVAS